MKWLGGLMAVVGAVSAGAATPVINGKSVPSEMYPMVVQVKSSGTMCSGTVMGPRIVVVPAHCVTAMKGAAVLYTGMNKGKQVPLTMIKSPLFPAVDHDIAVGISETDLGVEPGFFGEKVALEMTGEVIGFGCDKAGGSGEMGLRMGAAKVTAITDKEVVTEGAALCFGDSGAPLMVKEGEDMVVAGVGSKSNMKELSYFTLLGSEESQTFFDMVVEKNKVDICGFNSDCGQ